MRTSREKLEAHLSNAKKLIQSQIPDYFQRKEIFKIKIHFFWKWFGLNVFGGYEYEYIYKLNMLVPGLYFEWGDQKYQSLLLKICWYHYILKLMEAGTRCVFLTPREPCVCQYHQANISPCPAWQTKWSNRSDISPSGSRLMASEALTSQIDAFLNYIIVFTIKEK